MIQFFQVVFFVAAIILIVLNILQLNNYREAVKQEKPFQPVRWFNFVLTSLVAIGCMLNILIGWIRNS